MGVHKDYPAGVEPKAGPFCTPGFEVSVIGPYVVFYCKATRVNHSMTVSAAREFAAAMIECADYISRAAMTPEDIAHETRNRC